MSFFERSNLVSWWYIIHLNSVTIEAVKKFVPPIHFVYVPEIENIVEPEDVGMARKID